MSPKRTWRARGALITPTGLDFWVDYLNMHKAGRFYFRQDIVQRVPGWQKLTSRAHGFSRGRAATSFTVSDLSNHIRLGDDADHRSVRAAHDQQGFVRVA